MLESVVVLIAVGVCVAAGCSMANNSRLRKKIVQQRDRLDEMRSLSDSNTASCSSANMRAEFFNSALEELRKADLLLQSASISEFYTRIIKSITNISAAEFGAIGVVDGYGRFVSLITENGEEITNDIDRPIATGALGEVLSTARPLRLAIASTQPDFIGVPSMDSPTNSLLCVPIVVHEQVRGVLYLANKRDAKEFSTSDEAIVSMFCSQIEHTLERNELLEELKESNLALQKDIEERHVAEQELIKERKEHKALIQKLQNAQNQLLQSEKLASIGQLAAGVAHEINNPVGYISSNLGCLKGYVDDVWDALIVYREACVILPDDSAEAKKIKACEEELDLDFLTSDLESLMRETQEGLDRVKQIVQDLKDFSHVDEVEWQWADLHKGLNSTLNIVHNELKYKADVKKEFGSLPLVECVVSQLNQVFLNLLVNAAQSIEEYGVISVKTGAEENEVWVEITDTGQGIPQDKANRIFEPFFTTKPVGKGTGLGLSLAYGIVNKHGGRIDVKSEVGKGSNFRVWLPIKQLSDKADAVA